MIIRTITHADIPSIIHLGGRMHEESQYSCLTYSPQKVADRCYQAINNDMLGLVAVNDGDIVGMLGAQVHPHDYSEELIASDLLVYVAPDSRGSFAFIRLVRKYVTWAKEQGARMIFQTQTTGIDQESFSRFYKRLGFRSVGGIFCLEVHSGKP